MRTAPLVLHVSVFRFQLTAVIRIFLLKMGGGFFNFLFLFAIDWPDMNGICSV